MAREIEKLTDRKVAALIEPGRYGDGLGLYLQVLSPANRSWLLRYELSGRERWMGLGPAHTFSLSEARERARQARQQITDGVDPIEARQAARDHQRKQEWERISFKEAAIKYLALHEPTWRNAKHRQQWRNTLNEHAYPPLGNRPVKAVDAALINAAVAPIWRKTPETAQRVKQRIERIVRWVQDGMPLPAPSAARRVKHHKAMDYSEVPAFIAELRQREGTSARALEFLILVAARTNEVIGARWPEFDLKAKVWGIPASRMKAGKEHKVPLSSRALEILQDIPREKGNSHVFVGARQSRGLSNMAMLELLKGMGRNDAVVHGFRSSFKDWASERTNYPNLVSEMALAHSIKDKTEKAYRRGDLLIKRTRLMADWARYCSGPHTDASVTPLRSRV